jgi:hypothetical protein
MARLVTGRGNGGGMLFIIRLANGVVGALDLEHRLFEEYGQSLS